MKKGIIYYLLTIMLLIITGCSSSESISNVSDLNNNSYVSDKQKLMYSKNRLYELEEILTSKNINYDEIDTIVFGNTSDYSNIIKSEGINIDQENSGSIKMYMEDNGVYILSDETIYFCDVTFSDIGYTKSLSNHRSNLYYFLSLFNRERLEKIVFENINTSLVTNMADIFWGCKSLKSLDLTKFDTSNVINMEGMFQSCNVETIDLSSFDTCNVLDMSKMFDNFYCSGVLNLSSFNTVNVLDYYSMFYQLNHSYSQALMDQVIINQDNWTLGDSNTIKFISARDYYAENEVTPVLNSNVIDNQLENINKEQVLDTLKFRSFVYNKIFVKDSAYHILNVYFGRKSDYQFSDNQGTALDAAQSGNIMGFYEKTNHDIYTMQFYNVYILSDDIIVFDDKSSRLFELFQFVKNIEFSNIDTSCVTDMTGMFSDCADLKELDLSWFNTINVQFTSASSLFREDQLRNMDKITVNKRIWTLDLSDIEKMGVKVKYR